MTIEQMCKESPGLLKVAEEYGWLYNRANFLKDVCYILTSYEPNLTKDDLRIFHDNRAMADSSKG